MQVTSIVAIMFVTNDLHVFINDVVPINPTYHSKYILYTCTRAAMLTDLIMTLFSIFISSAQI